MRIGMILHPYGEKSPGGLGRSIFEMVKAVVETHPEHDYTVYLKDAPPAPLSFSGAFRSVVLNARYLWLSAGKHFESEQDVHLFFTPVIPLFSRPKRSVVMVFDFAYLEIPPHGLLGWFERYFLYAINYVSLKRADGILAISHDAAAATQRFFGVPLEKITVTHIGFIGPDEEKTAMPVPDRFFLFAGVLKERKNVHGIIRAFAHVARDLPDHMLLIAGKTSGAYYESLKGIVSELGLESRVRFLGYVTNAQLSFLYGKAVALVFPSLIEGFGMPVLEANSVGLPVITSNTGSLAEVAGDAALCVDPLNPEAIGSAMRRIANDAALRTELVAKGYVRAGQFSWKNAADGIVRAAEASAKSC